VLASVIIRTYNESKHLGEVLRRLGQQDLDRSEFEVIVVDSGSTDGSREIGVEAGARLITIDKSDFSFGRSLNRGCSAAKGEYCVLLSGHCLPMQDDWLRKLVTPLCDGTVTYTYGRQVGNSTSKFSECQLFAKQFPETSKIPQEGHFCNNANAALPRKLWEEHRFDEDLTGLEDMELAKRFVGSGLQVGYVAEASVLHLHEEDWPMVRRRYEREAIALQYIMPQIHVGFRDFVRYFASAVLLDVSAAIEQRVARRKLREIVMFRLMQYWGTYQGNHEHRKSSREMKEVYFYPR